MHEYTNRRFLKENLFNLCNSIARPCLQNYFISMLLWKVVCLPLMLSPTLTPIKKYRVKLIYDNEPISVLEKLI